MRDMRGLRAVVTGGASGIGLGMAESFLARGARVGLLDVNPDALSDAILRLGASSERVVALEADVTRPATLASAYDDLLGRFGGIDIVCANAGVGSRELPLWELPIEEWRWVFDINVFGIISTVQALTPDMLRRDSGHIVITASMQGITTGRVGPYASSKHAAASLAESLYADLERAGSGVRVSCLCPSYTRNSLVERGVPARDVGDLVADAVGTELFWIIPNRESLARVAQRATEIIEIGRPSLATS